MLEAMCNYPEYQPVIAAAPGISVDLYDRLAPEVKRCSDTFRLEYHSEAALVTSGTATLESALIGVPQIVTYRAVGSKLVYNIFKHILKVKFVSLPNLIVDREIVPELLLHQCTPANVADKLKSILPGGDRRDQQIKDYALMKERLGDIDAAMLTASLIIEELNDDKG